MLEESFYRTWLRRELEKRAAKNPRYSLRAFAAAIGMDPTGLSRVLSGKKPLAPGAALRILSRVRIPLPEQRRFLMSAWDDKWARELQKAGATLPEAPAEASDLELHNQAAAIDGRAVVGFLRVALDAAKIPLARQMISRFMHVLAAQLGGSSEKKAYLLAISMKPLEEETEPLPQNKNSGS